MFTVRAKRYQQDYDRWVDALEAAKPLQAKCGWFDEVQILEKGELVWVYSRGYKYPRFIGAGVYDRLAKRFALESTLTPPSELDSPTDNQLELPLENPPPPPD
jgi:hypothetical protein